MHILIFNNTVIPALKYGGIERMMWWLGKALAKGGHQVTFLVKKGSYCNFAKVIPFDPTKSVQSQIPEDTDLIHAYCTANEDFKKPVLYSIQVNAPHGQELPLNSVFVSQNHAKRYGSTMYVHNGLDFDDYGKPHLNQRRTYLHFLAKAAWRLKNVKGAIDIATRCKEQLMVIGGYRLNIKMGFRFTPNLNVRFLGMLGGEQKNQVLKHSKGLLFPVLWYEPFGIAIIESLYFGCPVFGTPYGSLPELVPSSVGFLSTSKQALIQQITTSAYDPKTCHEYIIQNFDFAQKAKEYIALSIVR